MAHFRKTFLVELEDLFIQVLTIAKTMKPVKLGTISLDDTKIKANASKHKALSHGYIEKLEAQLRAEIASREQRLQALADAKAKIAERVKERDQQALQDYADKVALREAQRAAGQKPRGKEPKASENRPKAKDQINLTDEESRIMPRLCAGAQRPGAAVDVDSLLIIAATLTQDTNDKQQVGPMLDKMAKLESDLGKPDTLLADNGYFSRRNVTVCEDRGITPLTALAGKAFPSNILVFWQ